MKELDIPGMMIRQACPKIWEYILFWEQKEHEERLNRIRSQPLVDIPKLDNRQSSN
jgi:hypothetical protein